MTRIRMRRLESFLLPESGRVIIRPFIPSNVAHIIQRCLAMNEQDVARDLALVLQEFDSRHFDIESILLANYDKVFPHVFSQSQKWVSRERTLLIGALFSGEYSLESAALFNPSIVTHPDQTGMAAGELRFVMSLRATGEGHISSIEFRSGSIDSMGENIQLDPVSRLVAVPEIVPNPSYDKSRFLIKLQEMGVDSHHAALFLAPLPERFSRSEVDRRIVDIHEEASPLDDISRMIDAIQWLADSNYEIRFSPKLALSERIIFPVSKNESNGIEDARFVQFTDNDGSVTYYATYTAYNGNTILPQLIETQDFLHFRVATLNGHAVQNKGMALFPRRINGRYAMLSRQDDENLLIMFSDSLYYWSDPQLLLEPSELWESVKIGNNGSPLETEAGWLVITHGVGPMRKYCLGAALLDLDDPTKVLGRLKTPFLSAEGNERDGYVPNVVYSCGALIHHRQLILPYAMSDKMSTIVSISLDDLLAELKREP